jgi:hypothetical protein
MAKKFLSAIQLLTVGTDPVTASAGDLYFNNTLNLVKYFDGTSWVAVPKLLQNLNDVSASGVIDGQTLIYNSNILKWENKNVPSSAANSGSSLPLSAINGTFFYHTVEEKLYFYFNQWILTNTEKIDLDGGNSTTQQFLITVDGGDSDESEFSPIYNGETSI